MTNDTTARAMTASDGGAAGPGRTVLLVGATGMLGARIAVHLLETPGVQLRLLLRRGALADPAKRAALQPLIASGATTVDGDLTDPSSLHAATQGVDVVVSAVQGGRAVVVDGQIALARAAARSGVRRILSSDFALDLFKATPGEHASFDLRAEAARTVDALGLESVHVLTGALIDGFVHALFDHDARTATYWGSGSERFDATTVDDTAAYTARAALDPAVRSGKLAFAGEQLSFGGIVDAIEAATGHTYARRSLGSVEDLRAATARARSADPHAMMVVMMQYQLYMLTGQTALEDLQNTRYPDVRPQTFAQLAARTLAPQLVA